MKEMKSNPSKTVLTISVGFLFVYLFAKLNWALWVSFGIGLTGVFSDYLSQLIEKVWMKLAFVLSKIVPNIILGIIFFALLLPISLLSKVFTFDYLCIFLYFSLGHLSKSTYILPKKSLVHL